MSVIGIDAHAIGEKLTGNETYIRNLIEALLRLDSGHEFVLYFTQREAMEDWRRRSPKAESVLLRPTNPLVRIPLTMPLLGWLDQIDLLHVQYVGPPFIKSALVAVIHDISFERFPEFFSKKEVAQFRLTIPFTARHADRVLTISECSKRDMVEKYGIAEEKIVVTYLGVAPEFRPLENHDEGRAVAEKFGINGAYILAVGNLQPRKNLVRLINAYTRLRNARPDLKHKLVIVGKKAWKSSPILDFVNRSRWSDDIILTDYVPGADLPALYANADIFVYPSIYEGFGLPPLESMACGTPVIVSETASLPEVVGNAGIKVNPFDIEALAAAMGAVLLEPKLAEWYGRAGIERAGKFTWDDCARKTMRVYEDVIRERGR